MYSETDIDYSKMTVQELLNENKYCEEKKWEYWNKCQMYTKKITNITNEIMKKCDHHWIKNTMMTEIYDNSKICSKCNLSSS